jgi:hypothetical protein
MLEARRVRLRFMIDRVWLGSAICVEAAVPDAGSG